MSHAKMLKARRAKQSTKKRLAGIAKRAKKLRRQEVKPVGADAPSKAPPALKVDNMGGAHRILVADFIAALGWARES